MLLLGPIPYMCNSTCQDVDALCKNKDSGIGKVVEETAWLKGLADEVWVRDAAEGPAWDEMKGAMEVFTEEASADDAETQAAHAQRINSTMELSFSKAAVWKLAVRPAAFEKLQTVMTKSLQDAVERSKVDDVESEINVSDEALTKLTKHVKVAAGIFNSPDIMGLLKRVGLFMKASQAKAVEISLITGIDSIDAADLSNMTPADFTAMVHTLRAPFPEAGSDNINVEDMSS